MEHTASHVSYSTILNAESPALKSWAREADNTRHHGAPCARIGARNAHAPRV